MKAKHILWMVLLLAFSANANQDEAIDADFLEFLADMEEVTGDGFDTWLESDTEQVTDNDINTEDTTSN